MIEFSIFSFSFISLLSGKVTIVSISPTIWEKTAPMAFATSKNYGLKFLLIPT